ncbi:MAG: hypothetical protein AAB551_02680 [Patescibacteria group bacterium]
MATGSPNKIIETADEARVVAKANVDLLNKDQIIKSVQKAVDGPKARGEQISMLDVFENIMAEVQRAAPGHEQELKKEVNQIVIKAVETKVGTNMKGSMEAVVTKLRTGSESVPAAPSLDDIYKLTRPDAAKTLLGEDMVHQVMLATILRDAHRYDQSESRFANMRFDTATRTLRWNSKNRGYTGTAVFEMDGVAAEPDAEKVRPSEEDKLQALNTSAELQLRKIIDTEKAGLATDKDLKDATERIFGAVDKGGLKPEEQAAKAIQLQREGKFAKGLKGWIEEVIKPEYESVKNTGKEMIAEAEKSIEDALKDRNNFYTIRIDVVAKNLVNEIFNTKLTPEQKALLGAKHSCNTETQRSQWAIGFRRNLEALRAAELNAKRPEAEAKGKAAIEAVFVAGKTIAENEDAAVKAVQKMAPEDTFVLGFLTQSPAGLVLDGTLIDIARHNQNTIDFIKFQIQRLQQVEEAKKAATQAEKEKARAIEIDHKKAILAIDASAEKDLEPGETITSKSEKIFQDLKRSGLEKPFARYEKFVKPDGEIDEDACREKIEVYLSPLHGELGHLQEMDEFIDDDEKTKVLDNLDLAKGVLDEMQKTMGITDRLEAAKELYEIIKYQGKIPGNPTDHKKTYLKFLRVYEEKFKDAPDVTMVNNATMCYFLQAIIHQGNEGKTANLVFGKNGWEKKVGDEWSVNASPESRKLYERDMDAHKRFMDYLISSHYGAEPEKKDATPPVAAKPKLDRKELTAALKDLAENYKVAEPKRDKLREALRAKFGKVTADREIQYVYKVLIYIETGVDIRRMEFIEVKKEKKIETHNEATLDEARNKYAEKRRKLSLFFKSRRHGADTDVITERGKYQTLVAKNITDEVTNDADVKSASMAPDALKATKEKIAEKIIEKLLDERKKLLQKEISLQKDGFYEKFKTMWRKHPWLRAAGGAALLTTAAYTTVTSPLWLALWGAQRFAGGFIGTESIWETLRNRSTGWFTKKNDSRGTTQESEKLAAYTTLATSTKPGFSKDMPKDLKEIYADPGAVPGIGEYRAKNYAELEAHNRKELKDCAIAAMDAAPNNKADMIKAAIESIMKKEEAFMHAVEQRETWLRGNNVKKKLLATLVGLGAMVHINFVVDGSGGEEAANTAVRHAQREALTPLTPKAQLPDFGPTEPNW